MTDRARDLIELEMLDMRDHEFLTNVEIANRLGVTRSTVSGVFARVRDAEAGMQGKTLCDGTMPRRWWDDA